MDIKLQKKPWYIRYRYHIMAGAAILALVVYSICLAVAPQQMLIKEQNIIVDTARNDKFHEYVDVEGIVQPIMTIKINTLEGGTVERIMAEDGTMLHKGDTILIISNPDLLHDIDDEEDTWANQQRLFREQEIEMQQKSITLREQTLDARHELASLDKNMQVSREEYRMGIKSKAEMEMAEEDYKYRKEKTMLRMKSLAHDSVATQIKRELMNAQKVQHDKKRIRAELRTKGLVVTAPADGQLSYVRVTVGDRVAASTTIGELKVLSKYKIHTTMSEYYMDRIAPNLPATVKYQDNSYPLRISRVVPEVKDRGFDVDLVFTGKMPQNMRVGKTFRVQIELSKPERAMIVKRGDFYQNTGGEWIYKLKADGKTAVKVPIEIGRQNPQYYEVTSGLSDGDRVIVGGYEQFGDVEQIVLTDSGN